jgi:hypothetical protein
MLQLQEKELRYSIKSVDFNNDAISDIIYSGPWGGEGNIVHFFIRYDSGFQNIFTLKQGITKVVWKNNLIDKIYAHDWGCCADPTLKNQVYNVTYANNIPQFELIWESIELEEFIVKPKNYWEKPKRFEISNELYKFRGQPYIDDTTQNYHLNITGNTIGLLEKGFRGSAYILMTQRKITI